MHSLDICIYCQQLSGESHARFGGCLQKRGEYRSVCGEEQRLVETNSTTSTTSCCSHEAAGRKGEEGRKGWEHTFTCSSCSQVQFWKTLRKDLGIFDTICDLTSSIRDPKQPFLHHQPYPNDPRSGGRLRHRLALLLLPHPARSPPLFPCESHKVIFCNIPSSASLWVSWSPKD